MQSLQELCIKQIAEQYDQTQTLPSNVDMLPSYVLVDVMKQVHTTTKENQRKRHREDLRAVQQYIEDVTDELNQDESIEVECKHCEREFEHLHENEYCDALGELDTYVLNAIKSFQSPSTDHANTDQVNGNTT